MFFLLCSDQVCGGTNKTSCHPSNVGACQVKRRDPTQVYVMGQANTMLYYYDGMLNLTYVNGTKCHNGVARTTHITFLCNETAADDGVGAPQYEKENHCVYNFRWFTKYACPAKVSFERRCMNRVYGRQPLKLEYPRHSPMDSRFLIFFPCKISSFPGEISLFTCNSPF